MVHTARSVGGKVQLSSGEEHGDGCLSDWYGHLALQGPAGLWHCKQIMPSVLLLLVLVPRTFWQQQHTQHWLHQSMIVTPRDEPKNSWILVQDKILTFSTVRISQPMTCFWRSWYIFSSRFAVVSMFRLHRAIFMPGLVGQSLDSGPEQAWQCNIIDVWVVLWLVIIPWQVASVIMLR